MDSDINAYKYLTTYRKHFVKKPFKLAPRIGPKQEFADPVAESHKKYLLLDEPDVKPPNEDGELYLEKFKGKRNRLGAMYFKDPLNKELIFRSKITGGIISEYQMNYCDVEKDIQYYVEQRGRKHSLPDDADIPLTTYTTYFRNPHLFYRYCGRPLMLKADDNLETHGKFIGNTTSEYADHIGRLGGLIVKEDMYGYRKRFAKNLATNF